MVKILIADDNERIRSLIKRLLKNISSKINIIECSGGDEAISLFNTELPDLILMDIAMQKVDGLTAIKKIRQISLDVKIIVISQLPEDEYKREAIIIGANYFLSKENLADLPSIINKFFTINNNLYS